MSKTAAPANVALTAVVNKTGSLRQTLDEEQVLLATRRRERDRMIKCDEVAAKITARGKNRQELDEYVSLPLRNESGRGL